LTFAQWLSRSDSKIREELRNSRLRRLLIGVIIVLQPLLLILLTLADSMTGSSIRIGWISFWYLSVFRIPLTPTIIFILDFFYDLLVVVLLVLLPFTITLALGKCPNTSRVVAERFALFAIPILALWHVFTSLLLLQRPLPDMLTNADPTLWGDVAGLSLVAQYLCWGVTIYELPAPVKDSFAKRNRCNREHSESRCGSRFVHFQEKSVEP